MYKFALKRPPRVRLFKMEKDILRTVHRNLSRSKIYYVLLYNQNETLLGTYQDGFLTLPEGKDFNEYIMNELRIFDYVSEIRIVKNEEKLYMGRQIIDENNIGLSDSIKKVTDSDYLYDELCELTGETNKRSFNVVSTSRKRIHKGLVGGHLDVPASEVRWIGVRNYIEAIDESGLKFTDSRLTILLDNKRQLIDASTIMSMLTKS